MKPRRRLKPALALALVILSGDTAVVPGGEVALQTQPDRSAPGPPTLDNAISGMNSVRLTWSAASNGGSAVSGYRIYRGTQPGGENLVTPVATVGDMLSYTDSTASFGFTYYYKVSAVNDAGEGALSAEGFATPAALRSPGRQR
jgi:hypothetical protein